MFPGMGGMRGFDMNSPDAPVMLAREILDLAKRNKRSAAGLSAAVRHTILSMITGIALVSQAQNIDDPILLIDEEHEGTEDCRYTPEQLMESLLSGMGELDEPWQELVNAFLARYDADEATELLKKMPETLTVADILGEQSDSDGR